MSLSPKCGWKHETSGLKWRESQNVSWAWAPRTGQRGASLSPTLFVGQQWTSSLLEETRLLWGWTGSSAYRPHSSRSALTVAPVHSEKAASNSQPPPRGTLEGFFWGTLGQRAQEECQIPAAEATHVTTETLVRGLSHSPLPPPSARLPAQVRPCWKMYRQHTSHQVFSPPGSKSWPSPVSCFTLGSFSPGEKMVLTSGGLNPLLRPLNGPPPRWPSIPLSGASVSASFLSGLGTDSGDRLLSNQAASRLSRLAGWGDGCRRTAFTTTAPLLALETRILAPGGGQVPSGASSSLPGDVRTWTTGNAESSGAGQRVGTYFRLKCITLALRSPPNRVKAASVTSSQWHRWWHRLVRDGGARVVCGWTGWGGDAFREQRNNAKKRRF